MAAQKISPLTFSIIILSLLCTDPEQLNPFPISSEVAIQNLATARKHPLTPPGKPAPEDSSSTGSTT